MAPAMANRFALFAEEDGEPSPTVEPTPKLNPFVNQVADNDAPWEEVKRSSQASKPPPRALVIRGNENKPPVTRSQPKARNSHGPTLEADSMKVCDPYENWCDVCQFRLPTTSALFIHIRQSPQRHEHYCNLCKRIFKDRNGLQNHVDNAAGHEIFCNSCLSAFVHTWGLKNHLENSQHVSGHGFPCLTCLLGFGTKAELRAHLSTSPKHVCCSTCHRTFKNQTERDEHWRVTTQHRHCLQPGCDFDASNDNALEKHLQDGHFRCEGCKHIFPSLTKLNAHYGTCTVQITCPNCGTKCAGQADLALHMESCFYCADCQFHTNHSGNYQIHMSKHAAVSVPCWTCGLPLRKCSSLINHLESGNCPNLPDPTQLIECLGTFWYSTLYMEVDLHVQIRSKRIDLKELVNWMNEGLLHPFICRAPGCGKTFSKFSALALHVEGQDCEWDAERLKLDLVEAEFHRMFPRKGGMEG